MMNLKKVLLLALLLLCWKAQAKNELIIPLFNSPPTLNGNQDLQKIKEHKEKLEKNGCYDFSLDQNIPESNHAFFSKAYQLAEKSGDNDLGLFYKSLHHLLNSNKPGLEAFTEVRFFLQDPVNHKNPFSLALTKRLINEFIGNEQFTEALWYLDLYDELKIKHFKRFKRFVNFSISMRPFIHYQIGNYRTALSLYQLKLDKLKSEYLDEAGSGLYHDVGLCYERLNKRDSADLYYNQALGALKDDIHRPDVVAFFRALIHASMNQHYLKTKEYDKVIPDLIELSDRAQEFNDGFQIRSSLFQLAELHYFKEDLVSANSYLDKLFENLEVRNRVSFYKKAIDLRAKISLKEGDFNKADSLWNALAQILEEEKKDEGKSISLNVKSKQSLKIKEKEIQAKKRLEEKQNRNLLISLIGLAAFFIIAVLSVFAFIRNRRSKRKIAHQNELLNESVDQKEMLLREIHHRVKNNLQIMSGLLQIQANASDNPELKTILAQSRSRIYSISTMHQMFYQNVDIKEVDAKEYFEKIMYQSLQIQDVKHRYKIDTNEVLLDMDIAIPLGLVLNEMITNSYKHAFAKNEVGEIKVSLIKIGNNFQFSYSDNGKGMDESAKTTRNSLGIRLIEMMVRQIDGELEKQSKNGMEYSIKFRLNNDLNA